MHRNRGLFHKPSEYRVSKTTIIIVVVLFALWNVSILYSRATPSSKITKEELDPPKHNGNQKQIPVKEEPFNSPDDGKEPNPVEVITPEQQQNHNLHKESSNTTPTSKEDEYLIAETDPLVRSEIALKVLKRLLIESSPGEEWIWTPTGGYKSTPYQPTIIENEPTPPKSLPYKTPKSVFEEVDRVCKAIGTGSKKKEKLCAMFKKCYPNTLETTTSLLDDGTTFIITGDIDLMWLRDSSAQVHQYLSLHEDPEIQRIIEGLIRRQGIFITKDPYGSSFRTKLRPNPPSDDDLGAFHVSKARNMYVAMHNYELDSLCYHVVLSHQWWKASGRSTIFTKEWMHVIRIIVHLLIVEQNHSDISPYRYIELPNNDQGSRVTYTGMTWTPFRPSDDQCEYGYLVPSNMFAVVALDAIIEISRTVYKDDRFAVLVEQLRTQIDDGIHKHAVIQHAKYGSIYAYEVNGLGGVNTMDDANVPSLLSIPYLQYTSRHDRDGSIAQNTRRFVMSKDNPFYYEGKFAKGIGSPHTPRGYIWHMAVIMQGLTTNDSGELEQVFQSLMDTDANTNFMHEGFNPNTPSSFTRSWFAWANSLFSELVLKHLDYLNKIE